MTKLRDSLPPCERMIAKARLHALAKKPTRSSIHPQELVLQTLPKQTFEHLESGSRTVFSDRLRQAGLRCSPMAFFLIVLTVSAGAGVLSLKIFSAACLPLFSAIGMWIPFAWLDQRIQARALAFSVDYPSILMAAASSIQVGLTPQLALERSVKLLPKESIARQEVSRLLEKLRNGMPREEAIQQFGRDYRLPDLELFRSAFLLVMETGGRFSPTLQRLASVSNNRMSLIKMASVTTASMRMTANVLLCIAPAVVLFLSIRIERFWDLFYNHPTANLLASLGILMITLGYFALKKMSSFRA